MDRENWDDLRYVLAVAEAGSVSGAARRLGVNHATVLRRVAAFEDRQGAPIFDRSGQGYVILPDKLRVIEAAREVSNAVETVDRLLKGAAASVTGVVRITSTDSLCLEVLPEIVIRLMEESPGLRIELHASNAHLDLGRLHADLTVRPSLKLPDDLIGEPAGLMRMSSYARSDRTDGPWLGLQGTISRSPVADWVRRMAGERPLGAGADSFLVLREMLRHGAGRAVLPDFILRGDDDLVRLPYRPEPDHVPVWVASHADLADAPRLRVLRMRLADELRRRMV